MNRWLVVTLALLATLASGCYYTPVDSSDNYSTLPAVTSTPTPTSDAVLSGEPPADRTWISPGKVNIDNYYAGGKAEYPITIHNGNDSVATFSVAYRYPDRVAEGYSMPIAEAQDWIIIADSTPVLMPKETKDIRITLGMPKNAKVDSNKWEFWIAVKDTTQVGFVQTELCSRWLVSMR